MCVVGQMNSVLGSVILHRRSLAPFLGIDGHHHADAYVDSNSGGHDYEESFENHNERT